MVDRSVEAIAAIRPPARRPRRRPGDAVCAGHRPHRRPGRALRVLGRSGSTGDGSVRTVAGSARRWRSGRGRDRPRVPPAVRRRPPPARGPGDGGDPPAAGGGRPAAQRRRAAALRGRGPARRRPRRDRECRRRAASCSTESPPDRVAVYPGLRSVGGIGGRCGRRASSRRCPGLHRLRGSPGSRAARSAPWPTSPPPPATGPPPGPTPSWPPGGSVRVPDQRARAPSASRRAASGMPTTLMVAAEQHAALGVAGDAVELADLAVAAIGSARPRPRAKASAFADDLRRRLRQSRDGAVRPSSR